MKAKTTAQWRREVPAYDQAVRAVEALYRGRGFPQHVVAHIHPDTRVVSVVLHGEARHTTDADRVLVRGGLPAGGWSQERTCGVVVWRKVVTS